MGLTGFYVRFVHAYAHHAAPLYPMLKQDTIKSAKNLIVPLKWTTKTTKAFTDLREASARGVELVFPAINAPLLLVTNTLDRAAGAALEQLDTSKAV